MTLKKLFDNKFIKSQSFQQMIKYGIVGVIGLCIDMGIYYLLVVRYNVQYPLSSSISNLLNNHMSTEMIDVLISNIIGTVLAIINNFILNSYFTFKVTDNKLKRFVPFISIAAVGLIISSSLLTLFIGILNMNEMIAKIISILIVAFIQFFLNKYFTFKNKKI